MSNLPKPESRVDQYLERIVENTQVLTNLGKPAWADITGKPSTFTPPVATTSAVGGVKQCATKANSTATDIAGLLADFNDLLAKLKAAGIMA